MSTATFPVYKGPPVSAPLRLLRGQVVIREELEGYSATIWTPPGQRKKEEGRVGRVLAMGPPAYFDYSGRCVEVPYGFGVGDRVVFVWLSNPHHYTMPWVDGEPAAWIPQGGVLAVIDMCECGKPGTRDVCDYDFEINDGELICNCCEACRYECRQDI
jgi:hypothetical protein